jgi:hypothetical protein
MLLITANISFIACARLVCWLKKRFTLLMLIYFIILLLDILTIFCLGAVLAKEVIML